MRMVTAVTITAMAAPVLFAQSEYRNIDGTKPLRIEDASAAERHELDWDPLALRMDRVDGRAYRLQWEPKLSYGILPRTELKLRMPIAAREPSAKPRGGVVGVAVSAFHNLNTESRILPAFAFEGELFTSGSGANASGSSWSTRAIATRSFGFGRLHANVGYATYRTRPLPPAPPQQPLSAAPPPIIDMPCAMASDERAPDAARPAELRAIPVTASLVTIDPTKNGGGRMLAGIAIDKAFPLQSVLIVGDAFVERYTGALTSTDWTTELGARHQLTPRTVVNFAYGNRFSGSSRSWYLNTGMSVSFAFRMFVAETR